ncbi:hypothetical protein FOL47_000328 [Perkinsus chesapeaki]|uniref:tRNA-uridine aminocarboxypropyltransferase n=1 Tax=Perkinsus chesapeaki TaxID=330153 RepID=A0A7J6KW15_PERCH|nr:hypothetical protein FOL47_000328 [Perkinsus chesapeaki]
MADRSSSIDHLVARLPGWENDRAAEAEASAVIEEATEGGKLVTNHAWNKKEWKETKKPINAARIEHLGSLPPAEREKVGVAITNASSKLMIEHSHRCTSCAMKKNLCVCDELRSLRPSEQQREMLDFDVAVYMHAKERYRASNTGKVLEKLYDAKIYLDSVDEDMQALQEDIDAHRNRCCVLFPSEDSRTVEELRSEGVITRPCQSDCEEGQRLLIILVDGTWKQAKRLQKRVDRSVPRVRLMPTTLSRFMCRTQSRADRVCTVEAAALLMSELGYTTEEYRLLEGLEVVVRAFNLQTFGKPRKTGGYQPRDDEATEEGGEQYDSTVRRSEAGPPPRSSAAKEKAKDLTSYLRSVGEVLKLGEASSGEPTPDVTANLPMISAVVEELKGQEALLLQDQTGSKHLQRLVRFLKNNNLGEELVDICSRLVDKNEMFYDQYGSHVIEEAVACLVTQLDNDQVKSMLKELVNYIIENFSDMVWDACATHVIRSLTLTLAGYIQPSTSSNKKKKKKNQQNPSVARDTALTLPAHKLEKSPPSYCTKLLTKLCRCLDVYEGGEAESEHKQQLAELCENPSPSVTVQLLISVSSPSEDVFKSILGEPESIRRLMKSGPGSRSLEVFISRCATEAPTVFHSGVIGFIKSLNTEEMEGLYAGGFGLYVLQAIISSIREAPHLHELLTKEGLIESLVSRAATSPPHLATLQKLCEACAHVNEHYKLFADRFFGTLGIKGSEAFPRAWGVVLSLSSSQSTLPSAPLSSGACILATTLLLRFPARRVQPLVSGFGPQILADAKKSEGESTVISYCTDRAGGRLIESLIDDSNSPIPQGQRMQFIRALVKHEGLIEKLATQPSAGSWVLAKMWENSIADAALRKSMAERLVKIEEDIKDKNMVLWKRLGLHEFKVANEEWEEKMQKQSQARELFDDILNLDTSKAGARKTGKRKASEEDRSEDEKEEEEEKEEDEQNTLADKVSEREGSVDDLADALALLNKKRKGGKSKAPKKKKRQQ